MSDRSLSHGLDAGVRGRHISRKIKLEGCKKIMGCGTLRAEGPKVGVGLLGRGSQPSPTS